MARYQDNVGAGSVTDSISTKKGRLEGGPFQTELVTILQFSRLATTVATAAAGTTASLARLAGLAQHKSRCGYDNDCHDNQFHVHTGTSLPHTRRMCAFSRPWRIHSGHRRHCRNGGRRIPRSDRSITAKDMSFLSFELGSFETNVKILNIIFNNYPKYFDPRHIHTIPSYILSGAQKKEAPEQTGASFDWSGESVYSTVSSPRSRRAISCAARLPAPMARITVAAPVTISPPAKTLGIDVSPVSSSVTI